MRVLAGAGEVLVRDRATQQERARIIASSPELEERDRTKTAQLSTVFARALARGGVAGAELLGSVCADAFRFAYDQALVDEQELGFEAHLNRAIGVVQGFFVPLLTS